MNVKQSVHSVAFPPGQDFLVPPDKGTMGQSQIWQWNRPGWDFGILPRDGPRWDYDGLSQQEMQDRRKKNKDFESF